MNNLAAVFAAFTAALFVLSAPATPITALTFSPDGSTLASSAHQRVELRSPTDARVRDSIACEFPRITALAFAQDGQLFVGGGVPGVSGAALLFTNQVLARRFGGYADLVTSVAVSSDGRWLGMGAADHQATLHALRGDAKSIPLTGHSGPVLAIAFSPDHQWVITASADRAIKVWSLEGTFLRSFNHHTEAVHSLSIRPPRPSGSAGQIECASGSDDRTVRVWQPAIGRMVRIIRGHGASIFALAYTPDGTGLFSAGKEGIVRQIDVESDVILGQRTLSNDAIYSLALSPNGSKLAIGDWSGKITLWDLPLQTTSGRRSQ